MNPHQCGNISNDFDHQSALYLVHSDVILWGIRWWGKKAFREEVKLELDHIGNKQHPVLRYETKKVIETAVILVLKELRED